MTIKSTAYHAVAGACALILIGWLPRAAKAGFDDEGFPPSRLRELEQKASNTDFTLRKNDALQQDNAQLRLKMADMESKLKDINNRFNPGRLQELERKALGYAHLKEKSDEQEQLITELERQLAEEKCLTAIQAQDIEKTKKELERLKARETDYKEKVARLHETVDQLRMGNYEFYEVKEGDTLSSIAALPMIYGDASKSELLRQANDRRIEDPEHLKPGEVLIVPRFKQGSGKYEF